MDTPTLVALVIAGSYVVCWLAWLVFTACAFKWLPPKTAERLILLTGSMFPKPKALTINVLGRERKPPEQPTSDPARLGAA
jgi:hypothetical protein